MGGKKQRCCSWGVHRMSWALTQPPRSAEWIQIFAMILYPAHHMTILSFCHPTALWASAVPLWNQLLCASALLTLSERLSLLCFLHARMSFLLISTWSLIVLQVRAQTLSPYAFTKLLVTFSGAFSLLSQPISYRDSSTSLKSLPLSPSTNNLIPDHSFSYNFYADDPHICCIDLQAFMTTYWIAFWHLLWISQKHLKVNIT